VGIANEINEISEINEINEISEANELPRFALPRSKAEALAK